MKRRYKILTLILTLAGIILTSTIFFHHIEGWSWLDSYFFTIVTISTVGYGSLVPLTASGKIATTVLIFFGLGVFAVAIQQFGAYTMRKREEHTEWLIARLGNSESDVEPKAANQDSEPQ